MLTVPNFLDFTINAVLHPTFMRKLYYKLSSIVTFTFIQIFFIKIVPSLLNGIRVGAFACHSVKISVIFSVRFERRKVDKTANLHKNWNMQSLFNISAKFHQNWSLQFWALPFQSWCIFSETQCTLHIQCHYLNVYNVHTRAHKHNLAALFSIHLQRRWSQASFVLLYFPLFRPTFV